MNSSLTTSALPDNRRPRGEALALHARLRARHVRETWLYLKPLLLRDLSQTYARDFPTHPAPELDRLRYTLLKLLWMSSAVLQQTDPIMALYFVSGLYHGAHGLFGLLEKSLLRDARSRGVPSPRKLPVPEFDWKNEPPEQFAEKFVRRPFPVVLRGFMRETDALRELGFDRLLEKYGDDQVLLTTHAKDGFAGKLSSVRDPNVYCHNSEFLFTRHPELHELLDYARLAPYSDGKKSAYSQLFIGRKGTGSPFHCAAVWNWFFMLDGRKRWSFVDPNHTLYMYPVNRMGMLASASHCSFPDQFNRAAFPLFEYCPFYEVELEPGDVMWIPPWWWHAVENLSEQSVAVASRWHVGGVVGVDDRWTEEDYDVNRLFSVYLQLGLVSPFIMQRLLEHPSPKEDEHTTLRESRNRFISRHYRIAERRILGIFHKM